MNCSKDEVMQYVREENVAFIRLAFCDVFGRQKNVSITPGELERAFEYGIAFDASSIAGFGNEAHSDLFLHPDPRLRVSIQNDRQYSFSRIRIRDPGAPNYSYMHNS